MDWTKEVEKELQAKANMSLGRMQETEPIVYMFSCKDKRIEIEIGFYVI